MKSVLSIIVSLLMTSLLLVSYVLGLPNLEVFIITLYSVLAGVTVFLVVMLILYIIGYDNGHLEADKVEKVFSVYKDKTSLMRNGYSTVISLTNITLFILTGHPILAVVYLLTASSIIKLRKSCRKRYLEFKNVQNKA
jgi:amino acid transporter|tara:strand:- start:27676 stop:28089 length:414 start_codon:yes stop_codon:yes gene_type:complete